MWIINVIRGNDVCFRFFVAVATGKVKSDQFVHTMFSLRWGLLKVAQKNFQMSISPPLILTARVGVKNRFVCA